MQKMLSLAVGFAAFALVSVASAQFDGPAPLAWRWQQPSTAAAGGSPLVVGNTIYQSLGGRVYSLDKDSANLKWRFPALDPIDGAFRSTPILADGTLVVASDSRLVYGVDPESGQLKWSFPTPSPVYGQPVIAGKLVIMALSQNQLIALHPSDGTMAWKAPYNLLEGFEGTMASAGDDVLFCTNTTKVVAFNVTTEKYEWSKQFTQLPPGPIPVVEGERVFMTSGPYLDVLAIGDGRVVKEIDTRLQLGFAPAVSGSGVMVVSVDGQIEMYDNDFHLQTKTPITLSSTPIARPTPVGSKFIITTSNGGIILLDPSTGKTLWDYIIHPIDEITYASTKSPAGGPGNGKGGNGVPGTGLGQGRGGPAGPGGGPGGGPGAGPGGGQNGPGGNNDSQRIYYIQAAGSAILAGQTLLIPAKDGSLLAFDKDLGIDLTPPAVTMMFPNAGEQVSGQPPLLLEFKIVDDNSGINRDTLKISVDNDDLDYVFTKEGYVVVRFSLTGKNKPLMDGRRTFKVSVADWMGNVGTSEFSLMIDNTLPPIKLPGSDQDKNQNGKFGGAGPGIGVGGKGDGGGD